MFWKNKPLSKATDTYVEQIENLKQRPVYQNEIMLPSHLEWKQQTDPKIISQFLTDYYKPMSIDYVKYLQTFNNQITLSIVSKKKNVIYGIIGGNINKMNVFNKVDDFVNVTFICVHPSFRNKKMVCILIEGLTKLYIDKGYNFSYFMTTKKMDEPVCTVKYFDRIINFNKMKDFIPLESGMNEKHFNICEKPCEEYKLATDDDMKEIFDLYNKYVDRFNIYQILTFEEFKKYFLPNKFIKTYLIYRDKKEREELQKKDDGTFDKVIDFVSFRTYEENSNEKNEEKYNVAELMYYTSFLEPVGCMLYKLTTILNDVDIDLFRISNEMKTGTAILASDKSEDEEIENEKIDYKFMKTKKNKYLKFMNLHCPSISSKQLSLIMV